eukprot:1139049-Pelagomonas_calceolata.AAC.10
MLPRGLTGALHQFCIRALLEASNLLPWALVLLLCQSLASKAGMKHVEHDVERVEPDVEGVKHDIEIV